MPGTEEENKRLFSFLLPFLFFGFHEGLLDVCLASHLLFELVSPSLRLDIPPTLGLGPHLLRSAALEGARLAQGIGKLRPTSLLGIARFGEILFNDRQLHVTSNNEAKV